MKRLFLFFLLIGYWSVVRASDTVFIKEAQVPILIERQDNLLFYLRFDARDSRMLDGVTVDLSRCKNLDDIQSVKDRKSTRLNSSHSTSSRMPSSA